MPVYKLKNTKTGLYWKGGGVIPFSFPENLRNNETKWGMVGNPESSQWSKSGKAWNQKNHFNSAISNMLSHAKLYANFQGTKIFALTDYKLYNYIVERLNQDCIVEVFHEPENFKFNEIYKGIK